MQSQFGRPFVILVALALGCVLSLGALISSSEPAAAERFAPDEWRGDADCSGTTDILDALAIALYTVELRDGAGPCPIDSSIEIDLSDADLDGDGEVTILDALLIARCEARINITPCLRPETIAANDQMIDAIEIFPNEAGFAIPEVDYAVQATAEADENDDNCVHLGGGVRGSVWHKFTATGNRVSVLHDNDDQYVGIYALAEGVTQPTQMSDLNLISCDQVNADISAIVQPGETYWVSVSDTWRQALWFFDGVPRCVVSAAGAERCPHNSNDDVRDASGIDAPTLGESIVVRNFAPGKFENLSLSYTPEELSDPGCFSHRGGVRNAPYRGSIWYRVQAAGDRLEIIGGDDQSVGIYQVNDAARTRLGLPDVNGLGDLTLLACAEPEERPLAETIPGEWYYIVSFGQTPVGQEFSLGVPLHVPNDEMTAATTIAPSATGTLIPALAPEFRASFADDENVDNCHRGNRRQRGSVWYQFQATTSRVSVHGSLSGSSGIYAAAPGVSQPSQMSDLVAITCSREGTPSAIVQPGETYWLSVNDIDSDFWVFDREPRCVIGSNGFERCPSWTNDDIRYPVALDVLGPGQLLVDDFGPGDSSPTDIRIELSAPRAEDAPETCIDTQVGSVWYRLIAQSTSLEVSGGDAQTLAIYTPIPDRPYGVQNLTDVALIGCGSPIAPVRADTVPGQVIYIVASGDEPGQVFSIFW